mmetsp:Transcript_20324/g.30413  ORF Transcript_20324/g.30413 Transcript_20324/m.30413 type:complete len:856 (-) Transcript_20324:188-2755(-)
MFALVVFTIASVACEEQLSRSVDHARIERENTQVSLQDANECSEEAHHLGVKACARDEDNRVLELYHKPMSWAQAYDFCQSERDMHLLSVTSTSDQETLNQLLVSVDGDSLYSEYWLGLNGSSTERNWTWCDGSCFSFENWATEEPAKSSEQDICVFTLGKPNSHEPKWMEIDTGRWKICDCEEKRHFICSTKKSDTFQCPDEEEESDSMFSGLAGPVFGAITLGGLIIGVCVLCKKKGGNSILNFGNEQWLYGDEICQENTKKSEEDSKVVLIPSEVNVFRDLTPTNRRKWPRFLNMFRHHTLKEEANVRRLIDSSKAWKLALSSLFTSALPQEEDSQVLLNGAFVSLKRQIIACSMFPLVLMDTQRILLSRIANEKEMMSSLRIIQRGCNFTQCEGNYEFTLLFMECVMKRFHRILSSQDTPVSTCLSIPAWGGIVSAISLALRVICTRSQTRLFEIRSNSTGFLAHNLIISVQRLLRCKEVERAIFNFGDLIGSYSAKNAAGDRKQRLMTYLKVFDSLKEISSRGCEQDLDESSPEAKRRPFITDDSLFDNVVIDLAATIEFRYKKFEIVRALRKSFADAEQAVIGVHTPSKVTSNDIRVILNSEKIAMHPRMSNAKAIRIKKAGHRRILSGKSIGNGWYSAFDKKYKKEYFYHPESGLRSWHAPHIVNEDTKVSDSEISKSRSGNSISPRVHQIENSFSSKITTERDVKANTAFHAPMPLVAPVSNTRTKRIFVTNEGGSTMMNIPLDSSERTLGNNNLESVQKSSDSELKKAVIADEHAESDFSLPPSSTPPRRSLESTTKEDENFELKVTIEDKTKERKVNLCNLIKSLKDTHSGDLPRYSLPSPSDFS